MFIQALLVALSYYLAWLLDSIFGFQTATRPIILGTITGLLCGDLKTGVIMGAALEAVYMGISGIGGVTAADYRSATAIAVGLTILSGITIEEGIALAAPIGALCLGLMNVTVAFSNIMEPLYLKTAKEGNVKKYDLIMWFHTLVLQHLIDTLVIFSCCYLGTAAIEVIFASIPAWVLTGLGASGGMLVVVGLCLTSQAIWSNATPFYVLLGFVLSKYINLPIMAIAVIGIFLAYMVYDRNLRMQKAMQSVSGSNGNGGDDFYA